MVDGGDGMREGSRLWWVALIGWEKESSFYGGWRGWDGEESSFRASWWKESRLAKLTISSG